MNLSHQISKHLRDLHFGGNWTSVNLRDVLNGVTWEQAVTQVHGFNTIATLVYHTHYYVHAVSRVLQGNPLEAKDSLSFSHPPILNEADWQQLLQKVWSDAETFADLIEQLPDTQLDQFFTDKKYGSYYRNLQGIIEHTHYHLGQIVLIRKLVQQQDV